MYSILEVRGYPVLNFCLSTRLEQQAAELRPLSLTININVWTLIRAAGFIPASGGGVGS